MPKTKRLTIKQRKFVEAYVKTNGNGTKSAAIAGYKGNENTLGAVASENLDKPMIREALSAKIEKAVKMGADEVLERLSWHARASIADVAELSPEGTTVIVSPQKLLANGDLVKELSFDRETGAPHVKLVDQQAALNTLARIMGLEKHKDDGQVRDVRLMVLNVILKDREARGMLDAVAARAISGN